MLGIENLVIRVAGREILSGATAHLPQGRRIGLVGRNGAGKSTLLRAILGGIEPDGGRIGVPKDWRLGSVAQEASGGETSLLDTVLKADSERIRLLEAADRESDGHRLAEIHARLDAIGAHSAPARAAAILAGLGFSAADQTRATREFSGGWRMRVSLAGVLFMAPDLLLLDEPTNYLDLEGVLWLESYLARTRGTVVIVSHDRDLLNRTCEFILHLERGKLKLYSGNYDRFAESRALKRAQDLAFARKQDAQRAHIKSFVDRFRAKASKARQAQSRLKLLAKMAAIEVPGDDHMAPIRIPEPCEASPPLVTLDNASVGYEPAKPVLGGLTLRIDPGDRIALLGKNGNGKSTLAKLLAGKLAIMGGETVRARKLVVGYFAQHQLEELDPALTPVETLSALRPGLSLEVVRTRLGGFGFSADKALAKVGQLSGGERARLMLALATLDRPNLLILDEPTNHLDIDARSELLTALNDFEGAVVLVSHDRRLLEGSVERLLLVADGTVRPFEGDLDDYRRQLLSGQNVPKPAPQVEAKETKESVRRLGAERRRALQPFKERVEAAGRRISVLEAELAKLDRALSDPLLFAREPAKGASVSKKRAEAARKLAAAEAQWLAAQEDYDAAAEVR